MFFFHRRFMTPTQVFSTEGGLGTCFNMLSGIEPSAWAGMSPKASYTTYVLYMATLMIVAPNFEHTIITCHLLASDQNKQRTMPCGTVGGVHHQKPSNQNEPVTGNQAHTLCIEAATRASMRRRQNIHRIVDGNFSPPRNRPAVNRLVDRLRKPSQKVIPASNPEKQNS